MKKNQTEGNEIGTITVKKDGQTFELNEQMDVKEAKRTMGLQQNDVLGNSKGQQIRGKLQGQVHDGENLASYPEFEYW